MNRAPYSADDIVGILGLDRSEETCTVCGELDYYPLCPSCTNDLQDEARWQEFQDKVRKTLIKHKRGGIRTAEAIAEIFALVDLDGIES